MFDPQEVMNKVQQKDYPQDWRVLVVRVNWYLTIPTLLFLPIAGYAIGGIIAALVTLLVNLSSWMAVVLVWLVGGLLFLLLVGWPMIENSGLLDRHTRFVFLPDGVVECFRGKREKMAFLHFDLIKKMDLDHQTTVSVDSEGSSSSAMMVWLNVYFQDGTFMKCNIPAWYGDPLVIGGTIVAAYEHFMQLCGQTPS
jgi:hypothetical protein